jgi:RTX calcium-binding nonapeptide repeat (4 copies)
LRGGNGNDVLYGGDDRDTIFGDAGSDTIYGEAGPDLLVGGMDADTLDGGAGDDELWGDSSGDTMRGGSGADLLVGGTGTDEMWGGAEGDRLYAGEGDDKLYGEGGDDALFNYSLDASGGPNPLDNTDASDVDRFDGGAGLDRIWLWGDRASYRLQVNTTDHTLEIFDVVRNGFSPGTVVARNVELIVFTVGPANEVTVESLGVPHDAWGWV